MTTSATSPAEGAAVPRPGLVVAVLSSVGLVASLCMTLVIPIVPLLPGLLRTTTATASWVITATLLAGAVATPLAGRLGDMLGKRTMLLVTLGLLVVGSVLCALTSDLVPVLIGRALQGVAVSAVPLGISLMRDALPPARLGSGIALMSATLGIGGGLGLPLSALLVEVADWHALFWTAGALGLVGALVVLAVIPETPTRSGGRFDGVGAVGLSVGLVCLLLAVSKGNEWGWASGATLGLAVAAVVVLGLWGLWELRVADPVVDLRISARRAVLIPNLISVPVGVAMFTAVVVYPQLLQAPVASGFGLGLSLLAAGLVLAPNGVVMMLMSPVTARISALAGPRTSLQVGLVVITIGYALGSLLLSTWWEVLVIISVIGAGVALSYGSLPALIMRAVPTTRTAAANGLNTLMRSLGTSTASAVAAVVLSSSMVPVGSAAGAAVPSLAAIRITLWIAAGCAAVALLASVAIPVLPEQPAEVAVLPARPPDIAASRRDDTASRPDDTASRPDIAASRRDDATGHPDPAPARLHGRVVLADGLPAAGARITAVSLDGRQLAVATAAHDGRYGLDAEVDGTVLLVAGHPRAHPVATHVRAGGRAGSHDLVLSTSARALGAAALPGPDPASHHSPGSPRDPAPRPDTVRC